MSNIVPAVREPVILISALVPVAVLPASNTCCNVFVVDAGVIQDTPVPVEDNTCPAVPIVVPSETVPVILIPAVVVVFPVALKVLLPLKVLAPNETILLPEENDVVPVPVNVIPNVVLFPAFNVDCKGQQDAVGTELDHCNPVPVDTNHCPAVPVDPPALI